MKDEEMAEEYRKNFEKTFMKVDLSDIEDAFLAGLKAGRPQWHDVKENPNDLPTEEKEYLVYTKEWGVEIRNYFADDKYFSCRENTVIAWCELPKFTED